jgi:hypothetical protein
VLDYQETMNNTYNMTVSGANPKNSQTEKDRKVKEWSMREQPFYQYGAASTESRQGSDGKSYEPSANGAEYFFDPKGLATCKLKIIGDPAWIQQGSVAGGVSVAEFNYGPFLADGTINSDGFQIMFEVAWQRPQDFNLATGLADPYAGSNRRQAIQSRVYKVTKVISEFNKGKFEQTLEGVLYRFPKPVNPTNKAVTAPPPNAGFGTGVSEFGEERPLNQEQQANRVTVGSADAYSNYGGAAGVGATGTSSLVAAPATRASPTNSGPGVLDQLPPNTNPTPARTPRAATSNGSVSAPTTTTVWPTIGQADVRAIDNAIAAGENTAAFGRFRPPRVTSTQIIAKDDR